MEGKNKHNILLIVGGAYIFGSEKISLSIIKSLSKKHKIHCAVNGWNDGEFIKELHHYNVSFTEIKLGWIYIRKPFWTLDTLINLPLGYLKYYKLLKNFNSTIVYHAGYRSIFQLYPFLKPNNVLHVHDKLSGTVGEKVLKMVDKKIVTYIAVSDFIKDDLIKCGIKPNKITVVYNGINFKFSDEASFPFYKDGLFRIGIVGQIIPRKGHDLFLKAMSSEKIINRNFILDVFGSGNEEYIIKLKKNIEKLQLSKKIVFHGYVKDKETIYNSVDFCVVPSIEPEPFGLVAIEPAVFSKPVIASSIGGLSNIIQHERTGLLFEPGNVEDLIQQLLKFMDNPNLILKMGKSARENYVESFSEIKMNNEVDKVVINVSNKFQSK